MALMIDCPNCGRRPHTEFWFGGETPPRAGPGETVDPEEDFRRVWLHDNVAGVQEERWFHHAGCRTWLTVRRDTRTNEIHDVIA